MCYRKIMPTSYRPRMAVFASGSGTTFRAVADAIHAGIVDYDIVLLITDRENAGALNQVADVNKRYGFDIKTEVINKQRYPDGPQGRGQTQAEAEATLRALETCQIDHLALLGCMRIIAPQVIEAFGWKPEHAAQDPERQGLYYARMSNTHPGILPATADTYGIHTQQKVLELALGETAQTLHVVATGVDTGPVIAENRVPVFAPGKYPPELVDTPQDLLARVQCIERAHLPLDLDKFLKDQYLFLAQSGRARARQTYASRHGG